jgi:tRNA pseudouridine13 synthase
MNASDSSPWRTFRALPRAFGEVSARGRLRVEPADFQVEEIPAFAPDGEGEHVLLWVRKTGANTEWVARRLAAHACVPGAAVSYAGLKDRHAVTSQWFSVHLGRAPEPDWAGLEVPGVEILARHRHRRKLRRGALSGNRFRIRARDLCGDPGLLDARLEQVRARGVPNYFGEQRFGHDDGNLRAARALFAGNAGRVPRHLRGLWLSAARSQIFNEVLAMRVERGEWDCPLAGDRLQLAGSHSHFLAETLDEVLIGRARAFDLDPTGPLWGDGELPTRGDPAALERGVAERFADWAAGLAAAGLRQERRALRLRVLELTAEREGDDLVLAFALPAGAYATAVLRELVDGSDAGLSPEDHLPPSGDD